TPRTASIGGSLAHAFLLFFIFLVSSVRVISCLRCAFLLLLCRVLSSSLLFSLPCLALSFFGSLPLGLCFSYCFVVFFLQTGDFRRLFVDLFLLCKNLVIDVTGCCTVFFNGCFNAWPFFFKLCGKALIGVNHAVEVLFGGIGFVPR